LDFYLNVIKITKMPFNAVDEMDLEVLFDIIRVYVKTNGNVEQDIFVDDIL